MTNGDDLNRAAENSRLLTKLSVFAGIGSLLLLVTVLAVSGSRGSETFKLAAIPYVFALIFSAAAVVYGILRTAVAHEDEEKKLLEKRMESRALNVEEDVRFTAGRSFANYKRFAPFALAVISALLMAFMLWKYQSDFAAAIKITSKVKNAAVPSPIHTALLAAVMMMVSVFAGAFFAGQSRVAEFRWLRPAGAWLIAGFVAMLLVSISSVCTANNITGIDRICSRILFWVFAVLGAEFAVNFVIEFYRPRTLAEARPVFESQLLAFFTEPGGVMRNIASALDYQFGFKVSGTWLYGFIERAFFPVLILWAVLFWGFTTVHEIGPNQVGIRETFGRIEQQLLSPGVYWTLPYPFGTIKRFSCTEMKSIYIGESSKKAEERASAPVVLWTNEHGGADDPFVVAVAADGSSHAQDANGDASISFVRMGIPIEYRVRSTFKDVYNYAYGNESAEKILRMIGEQAAAEYMAGATMEELLAYGRRKAEIDIARRIQQLADLNKLGIEIIRVGIMDAHPPVEKVAPAYQEVIAALEEKETEILTAKAYAATVIPEAQASALEIVESARSYSNRVSTVAQAESERFKSQLAAYRILPGMFKLNSKLEVLEQETAAIRKYIVGSGLEDEIYEMNFETRERIDLVDLDSSELSNQPAK
ncbi:MAG: protease modulator HflK [Lentisphaeria bacterium]|nr:protease modulator HflK [Lentisphaeria bacterium]